MTVYFAWVDLVGDAAPPFSSVHLVQDEDVFSFQVTHSEGEFPTLTMEIRRPNAGLLAPSRKRWAWLSRDPGTGAAPLFFGRLVGMPEQVEGEIYRLVFIARAKNWADQKSALADSLRTLPYYDPIWVAEEQRDDPDIVLQARSALFHTDRLTGVMTISDYITGEDGTVAVTHFRDGFDMRFATAARRKVRITAEAAWQQEASGAVDVTRQLLAAARLAGGFIPGVINTCTGQGLIESWPEVGTRIGGGWSVGPITLFRADGTLYSQQYITVLTKDYSSGRFPVWMILPSMELEYDVNRAYTEEITLSLASDLQPIVVGVDEDEPIDIVLSTSSVGEPIDGVIPIGDLRRRSYFQTERGEQSIAHLLERARAILRAEARAVEISADISFEAAASLTCRKSVTITDARIPGGAATGKVAEYSFGIDGDTGIASGRVTIGCTVGNGGTLTPSAGTPAYVDSYAEAGWQADTGAQIIAVAGDTSWAWGDREINDDGLDLFNMANRGDLATFTVTNGYTAQATAMAKIFDDLAQAAAEMNEVATQITLEMIPINGTGYVTEYQIAATDLLLPKTINLEAA
jgi:hypothetical protein